MTVNFKKLRKYLLIALLILYLGVIIFESIFNFDQGAISKLLSHYEDFSQLIYVLLLVGAILIGLISSAVVISGFFIFGMPSIIILTSMGIILGVPLIFLLSRKIGHRAFEKYINLNKDKATRLRKIFENDSTALVILFNFVSFLPSTFGGIIGGIGEKRLTKLVVISTIGNLINQISFIFLIFGIQFGNSVYIIPSLSVLILNTLIPLIIYRKNIKNVFAITFRKKKL